MCDAMHLNQWTFAPLGMIYHFFTPQAIFFLQKLADWDTMELFRSELKERVFGTADSFTGKQGQQCVKTAVWCGVVLCFMLAEKKTSWQQHNL